MQCGSVHIGKAIVKGIGFTPGSSCLTIAKGFGWLGLPWPETSDGWSSLMWWTFCVSNTVLSFLSFCYFGLWILQDWIDIVMSSIVIRKSGEKKNSKCAKFHGYFSYINTGNCTTYLTFYAQVLYTLNPTTSCMTASLLVDVNELHLYVQLNVSVCEVWLYWCVSL